MQAHSKIAVAGATGRVGRHAVDILRGRGHEVVAMSRSTGVDLVSGAGLAEALAGVDRVIDLASTPSPEQREATAYFTTATRNLHEIGERAGVQRLIVVSIIGIDRFTAGYNAAKQVHEREALAGPVPTRVLRAAQFHELVELLVQWGTRGDVSYVPTVRTQPVAARTVAEAAIDLAFAPDGGDAEPFPEIAGPREERMADLARKLVTQRGLSVRIEETSDPNDPDREQFANGALLPSPHAVLAGPTFDDWLGRQAQDYRHASA
jgi:uncharacterized protein YbjT (DUF2867 family)